MPVGSKRSGGGNKIRMADDHIVPALQSMKVLVGNGTDIISFDYGCIALAS